jgi:two-component system cell cycle response regulator CtrA
MRALIVDDDSVAAKLIQSAIEQQFLVEHTETGEDAVELAKLYDFDILILDLRLPDIDGGEVVRRLRANDVDTPVLILSGVEDRHEKIRGLICGADDYLTKPFDKEELSARLQAIVRRSKGHAASVIRVGRMTIDLNAKQVEIDGKRLHVTGKEYSILELLSLRKGMTLTKETFLDHLYGGMDEPEQKIIDVFICKLRKKIAALTGEHHNIETVWGRGYMLRDGQESRAQLNEERAPWGADGLADEGLDELDRLLLQLLPDETDEDLDAASAGA